MEKNFKNEKNEVIHEYNSRVITRRKDGSVRVQTLNTFPSKTHKQFKDQCDPNVLMKRYRYEDLPDFQNTYIDSSNLPSYQEALNMTLDVQRKFSALPSNIRTKFDNDPEKLLAFMDDPKNAEEAIQLGLAKKIEKKIDYQKELYDEVKKQNQKQKNTTTKNTNSNIDPNDL